MDAAGPYQFPVYAWVKEDPALEKIIEEPEISPEPDYVFKVKGKLNPAGCASRLARRLRPRPARARASAPPSAAAAPTRTCGRRPRVARSGRDEAGDLLSVGDVDQPVRGPVDNQGRHRELVQPPAGVVLGAGSHLLHDHRPRGRQLEPISRKASKRESSARKPGERLISHIARITADRVPGGVGGAQHLQVLRRHQGRSRARRRRSLQVSACAPARDGRAPAPGRSCRPSRCRRHGRSRPPGRQAGRCVSRGHVGIPKGSCAWPERPMPRLSKTIVSKLDSKLARGTPRPRPGGWRSSPGSAASARPNRRARNRARFRSR